MPKFLSSLEIQEAVISLRQSEPSEWFKTINHSSQTGIVIKNRREAIGATIDQIADLAGLPPERIAQIERGAGDEPFYCLLRVAFVLGLDLFIGKRGD